MTYCAHERRIGALMGFVGMSIHGWAFFDAVAYIRVAGDSPVNDSSVNGDVGCEQNEAR